LVSFKLQPRAPGIIAALLLYLGIAAAPAQQPDEAAVIQKVDAAVKARLDSIEGYTVNEHYAVFRGDDETHPVAEMSVKTTYLEKTGKSYAVLSQSGSALIQSVVLKPLLDNEKLINQPGNREASWLTSANYVMKLKPGGPQRLDGRECIVLDISPRRTAPNLIQGALWVDAKDGSIVQLQGTSTKSPSLLTGPAEVLRHYTNVSGFAQATHARAVSNSFLFGKTVITIDYTGYQVQLRAAR
jgi:outer membrane lipoprotein-sorting protein